jgi:hypothetical protein
MEAAGACPTSTIAGTVFERTRSPLLMVWFGVAWRLVVGKVGISADQSCREMDVVRFQTVWAMWYWYRSVGV